jgi:hypothetical protein
MPPSFQRYRAWHRMTTDGSRQQLLALLDGVGAHMPFEEAVADFPDDAMNALAPNVEYTPWHIVEHLRITQRDMLDYVTSADYPRLDWPADYWPARDAVATRADWDASVQEFLADRAELRAIAQNPSRDLDAVIPWARGHTIFRCVRIIGAHNAYHVGEFAVLRQVMRTWPPGHR